MLNPDLTPPLDGSSQRLRLAAALAGSVVAPWGAGLSTPSASHPLGLPALPPSLGRLHRGAVSLPGVEPPARAAGLRRSPACGGGRRGIAVPASGGLAGRPQRQRAGQMDGWTDGQMDRQADRQQNCGRRDPQDLRPSLTLVPVCRETCPGGLLGTSHAGRWRWLQGPENGEGLSRASGPWTATSSCRCDQRPPAPCRPGPC